LECHERAAQVQLAASKYLLSLFTEKRAATVAEQSFSWSLAAMRELNGKLVDMAHANADAVFDLASEVAGAKGPSDLVVIWSVYVRRQFELLIDQMRAPA
jgi:hypothetical protein